MNSVSQSYLKYIKVGENISDNIPPQKNYQIQEIFPYINKDNDFEKKYDSDAILGNIINIMYISKYTYPFDPDYGIEIEKYIFEYNDKINAEILTKIINDYIKTKEPRGNVEVSFNIKREDKILEVYITVSDKSRNSHSVLELPFEYLYNTDPPK